MYFATLTAICALIPIAFAELQIVPGATWTVADTGDHLQTHSNGIIKVGEWYYSVGENKTQTAENPQGNLFNSVAVSLYIARIWTWRIETDKLL